ncbi:MAG: ATP-binding protein [Lautropia sp.]
MTGRPFASLRGRLLGSLFVVIALAALLQGVIAYRTALAEADQLFDYNMRQMALSLRVGDPRATRPLPAEGDGSLDGIDFVVQVWTGDGLRIFESSPSLRLPQRAVLGFSDVRANGIDYRVYAVATPTRVIEVAQNLAVRKRLAGGIALRSLAPIALMTPPLLLIVWWVVTRTLAPVARVRGQLAARQADDLSPIDGAGMPDEVLPLIEELNALLQRLRAAFAAQRDFVADAAHELRSPLAALRLQLQGLQRAGDDATRSAAVERLGHGIGRAARLVEQLLALARQQGDVAAGSREPVDLAALARDAVAAAAPLAHARRVDLGVAQADAAARVRGDPDALATLLRNLVDNAIKYAPVGGTVDVAVVGGGDGVTLTVEDSGPGIAPADRDRVLDRFYRSPQRDPAVDGSGLGLAIVRAIAERHGARVTLDQSPRLGGLRATVLLPAGR